MLSLERGTILPSRRNMLLTTLCAIRHLWASKTLPLGSLVEVTNPATGKSVMVRINDRGPHVRGRSLDLSKRAAEELGITSRGVARLKIRRVDSRTAKSESTNSPGDSASASTP